MYFFVTSLISVHNQGMFLIFPDFGCRSITVPKSHSVSSLFKAITFTLMHNPLRTYSRDVE